MASESLPDFSCLMGDFPNFEDGNVEVILQRSPPAKIRLHSEALAKYSPWFATQFLQVDEIRKSQEGSQTNYRFKLVRNEEDSPLKLILAPEVCITLKSWKKRHTGLLEHSLYTLLRCLRSAPVVRFTIYFPTRAPCARADQAFQQHAGNTVDVDEVQIKTGKGPVADEMVVEEGENSVVKQMTALDGYRNFFKIVYSYSPKLDASDIGTLLNQSEALVLVANFLEGIASVRIHVTNKLTELRLELYNAIARNPVRWLNLSVNLKSKAIFDEAIIHCAGAFPDPKWPTPKEEIHEDALSIVYRKVEALDAWVKRVEMHMLSNTLCDSRTGKDVFPSNSRCAFLVVSLFRDWYLYQHRALHSAESRCQFASVFRLINEGGEKYLKLREVEEQFNAILGEKHGLAPAESLDKIKTWAKEVVAPLVKNTLMIGPVAAKIPYLTCVHVEEGDYPWEQD